MRLLLSAVLLALLAADARALQKNAGGSTAEFLKVGAGARSLGMGEAYTAVAEGPEAIYWNPAGLAQARSTEFMYSRAEFNQFFHHDFVSVAVPARALSGALGMSYTRFSQEQLQAVTNANIPVEQFAPHSDAVSLGYAFSADLDAHETGERDYFGDAWTTPNATRSLNPRDEPWRGRLMVGGALKYVSETLYNQSAQTVAFDGGALFRPSDYPSFCVSFVLRNAGGKTKFREKSESLPVQTDVGLSWDARSWKQRWLLTAEGSFPYYGNPFVKAGVEYTRPVGDGASFSVRGGFKTQVIYDLSPLSGLTFGLGAKLSKFNVDFGFQPTAELGQTYRFSVGMKW